MHLVCHKKIEEHKGKQTHWENSRNKNNKMQVFVKNKRKKSMNFIFHKTKEIKNNLTNRMCYSYTDINKNNVSF